jgi:starch synthase (maltosyl-transferring)
MPAFRPRIYQCENLVEDAGAAFGRELQDAAAQGFDHVMLDASAYDSLAPGASGKPDLLARAMDAIAAQQLRVVLRFSLDRPSASSGIRLAHADWLASATGNDALPDPRFPLSARPPPGLRFDDPLISDHIRQWWLSRLAGLAAPASGSPGSVANVFCFDAGGPAPADFFRKLLADVRAAAPSCRFLAWTPGAGAQRLTSLASCGFDAAFSSSAWWDLHSPWLAEEARTLRRFGSVIATAGAPGVRSALPMPEREAKQEKARRIRSLWIAAVTGDGMAVSREQLADMAGLDNSADAATVARDDAAVVRAALQFNRDKPGTADAPADIGWQRLQTLNADLALIKGTSPMPEGSSWLLAVHAPSSHATETPSVIDVAHAASRFDGLALASDIWPAATGAEQAVAAMLVPGETRVYATRLARAATLPPKEGRKAAEAAARSPRIAIERITPCIDGGRFVAKRNVGDLLTVEADIFGEGHDMLSARVLWKAIDEENWLAVPMQMKVNDRWTAQLPLLRVGRYHYQIEAWIDVFGAYRNEIEKKTGAGQNVALELREGRLLLEAALARVEKEDRLQLTRELKRVIKQFDAASAGPAQVAHLLSAEVHDLMFQADAHAFSTRSLPLLEVDSERRAAGFSSWYELFPRSMGVDAQTHGTLLDVIPRLPAIQAMGFDTLYFTPIHPIGRQHRKGPNNTLDAGPEDPGSPYAIGSKDGGHDAIHPELGTLEDFRTLRQAAASHGLELALDFAIQCSPDHPWLKDHPDWFTWRPDGTIRYAENPPKKYQDIVNVDFYAGGAVPKLWLALRDIVLFWVKEGVKVFRVDNPHTKPMPFWEWLIGDVRARAPEVIFLAEAFTRPKPMYRLAKLGFSQSYSYFTWRHTKQEFIDYLTELTQAEPQDFYRPHFFVNTPDINPYFLQRSGRAGFVIRAALAATLSGLWGMYSGFELCEAAPVPGKEEYLDSEKYELRQRDWTQPGNIIREITLLNHLRRDDPALQSHHGVRFCRSGGDNILCFTKTAGEAAAPGGRNSSILFIAICLDPHAAHECSFELPFEDWGLPEGSSVIAEDLVHGHHFTLQGRHHTLRLDPNNLAFTIWRLKPAGFTGAT